MKEIVDVNHVVVKTVKTIGELLHGKRQVSVGCAGMESSGEVVSHSAGGAHSNRGGWTEYFPGEPYLDSDSRVKLVEEIGVRLRQSEGRSLVSQVTPNGSTYSPPVNNAEDIAATLKQPERQSLLSQVTRSGNTYSLPVNVDSLRGSFLLPERFFKTLDEKPRDAISCLGAAAYEVLFGIDGGSMRPGRIHIRIFNFGSSMLPLRLMKAVTINTLITVRGTVIQTSPLRPMVVSVRMTCKKCGDVVEHELEDGIYRTPRKCPSADCGSRSFKPNWKSSKLIDSQKIRIEEIRRASEHEEGRMPRTVDCELLEDLVDACGIGDVVTMCGFVKRTNIDVEKGKFTSKTDGLYRLCVEALSIIHSKDNDTDGQVNVMGRMNPGFSHLDLEFVVKFAEDSGPDLFRNIVHSICPSIFGCELVKAGIALALLGGVQQNANDEDKVAVRGDIHVLIVGDPGLGKSQLLKAASVISSRGVYVCGNTTTTAGLTVTVVKDASSGEFVLDAGAVVLADGGMCCIDEFDKLSADHQALLEPMEQQCVSIAKAGLVATLRARTSILAAANPVGGRYDRSKTVNENVKLSGPLFSRFDLVFILVDTPNEALDERLSEHIMALHSGCSERQQAAKEAFVRFPGGSTGHRGRRICRLKERLQLSHQDMQGFEPLPPALLRKFIAYAREYVSPKLSREAAVVLKQFYLQLRRHGDGSPITARQLESLVRLGEARARSELQEVVTEQHALDAVDIMRESLFDKFIDEHGCLDFGRSGGLSHEREAKRFLVSLQQKCNSSNNATFSTAELYIVADEIGLKVKSLDAFIRSLNLHGYLLLKGHKRYQVQPLG